MESEGLNMNNIKGIMFDMDNTILRSKIDFELMKEDTFKLLTLRGILSPELDISNHTTSTIIREAMKSDKMTDEMVKEMWEVPKSHEVDGMEDADLEPGVIELLNELQDKYTMVVVTNNSIEAAETALERNRILDYFDCVVGREKMGTLKPAPDGFLYVLNKYKHISAKEWISVGDAWIDGVASTEAGVDFILYQGDIERLNEVRVVPKGVINNIRELKEFI